MNVTELARILKITPNDLKYWLPQFGYDIGKRAIKVNKNVASLIIRDWPTIRRKIEQQKAQELKKQEEKEEAIKERDITIEIPALITVRDFAQMGELQINEVLAELMKNGIFSSINEKIDFDTAWLVGSELGITVKKKDDDSEEKNEVNKLQKALDAEDEKKLLARPPVIVVMGHVDHGKTKLLDAIRKSDVVAGEAGGITQHIGAYQVKRNKQLLTFIDTPGHEAFTAMRSRGARIADIAILVVAADDGVKPQTVEAFKIIEAAKIPYVVAINKIDKEGADINKTKQELANKLNISPEDWGGKTICAPISALKSEGITELLDVVLLVAETESEKIIANPESKALGSIIESHIDKGAGPVATILVQNGTLRQGDQLTFDGINIGKVRCLNNYKGEKLETAPPATPAQIIGLKNMPKVGDILQVGKGERIKQKKFDNLISQNSTQLSEPENENKNVKKINIVIKSDVLGSAEAIEESLAKINTKEVKVKVLYKGLGNVSEGDLKRAEASCGRVISFNVKTPGAIADMARDKKIEIKDYSIIYDLINDIKAEMKTMVDPKLERKNLGNIKILAIFRTEKGSQILGGNVTMGQAENIANTEIYRDKEFIGEGKITKLQSGKQDVPIVEKNNECGLQHESKIVVEEGDVLKLHKNVKIK